MSFPRSSSAPIQSRSSRGRRPSTRTLAINLAVQDEDELEERPDTSNSASIRRMSKQASFDSKPISVHYAVNNQILAAFESFMDQRLYRGAYAFGMQYVEVALMEIPLHGYYYAPKHELERLENAKQALRVTQHLEYILQNHLADQAQPADWQRVATFKQRALDHHRLCQEHVRNDLDWEVVHCVPPPPVGATDDLCGDIMDFVHLFCPIQSEGTNSHRQSTPIATHATMSPTKVDFTLRREHRQVELEQREFVEDEYEIVPSPQPFLSRCNSASTACSTREDLQRALILSGIQAPPIRTTSSSSHTRAYETIERQMPQVEQYQHQQPNVPPTSFDDINGQRKRSVNEISIESLQACYHEDFEELRNSELVLISRIGTYQGRLPESINGCTVIAPLLCVHHFTTDFAPSKRQLFSRKMSYEFGLPDEDIVHVIDDETPALLPEVRSKLGLAKHTLIIPQDVHDFLLDKDLLTSEQFVAVVGGNVLDDEHLNELIKNLVSMDHVKLAATFFFHEHVIAILRMQQRQDGQVWFDVIDSLPNSETLRPLNLDSDPDCVPYACRIRCLSIDSLKATIRWFACSRFTEDNKRYIDLYAWEDAYSDYDPRVFQAYLWAEAQCL